MVPVKEKIAVELNRVNLIWKDLVNDRQPDVKKISDVFTRYKTFLEENKNIIKRDSGCFKEIELVEEQINHYYDVSAKRERMIILNDAYVGLILDLSESIEELKNKMEEVSFNPREHAFFN